MSDENMKSLEENSSEDVNDTETVGEAFTEENSAEEISADETVSEENTEDTISQEADENNTEETTEEEALENNAEETTEKEAPEISTQETASENTQEVKPEEEKVDEKLSKKELKKKAKEEKKSNPEKLLQKKYKRRKLKYGSAATAITVIVVAVVVLVNVVLSLLSDRITMSVDLTPDGTFEISQESIDYLETVNEPVEIVCMTDEVTFSTSNYVYFKQAYEVLKKYTIYSDNITLKFVDMTEDPTYTSRYSEMYKGDIDEYSIVISTDKRIKVLAIQDLYNIEMNYYTYSQEITSSKAEQELTSAIMYVTDPDPLNLVIWNSETGSQSYDNIYDLLVSNGYNVTEMNPLTEDIPEDTDIVCVDAPLNDYDEETVQKLYDFLDNDGNLGKTLIYIADVSQKDTSNINALLSEYGIEVGEGVVGDTNSANTFNSSNYVIGNYIDTEDNEYADNVSDTTLPVISYNSRPIYLLFDEKDYRMTKSLLKTNDTGFVLTDEMQTALENGESVDPETGSYNTMAAARKYIFDSDNNAVYSNILVVGSAEMLHSTFTGATYYNNGEYFISALNTLTGKTTGISIVAKDLTSTTFDMTEQTYNICFAVFVIVIPLIVVLIGIIVYLKRRNK